MWQTRERDRVHHADAEPPLAPVSLQVIQRRRPIHRVHADNAMRPRHATGSVQSTIDYADRGGIGSLSPESDTVPTWLGYIRVDNVEQAVERVKVLGGEVLVAPDPANIDGDLAIVADPVGTPIGLIRWDFPEEQEAQQ